MLRRTKSARQRPGPEASQVVQDRWIWDKAACMVYGLGIVGQGLRKDLGFLASTELREVLGMKVGWIILNGKLKLRWPVWEQRPCTNCISDPRILFSVF